MFSSPFYVLQRGALGAKRFLLNHSTAYNNINSTKVTSLGQVITT
jgi:hypothetical protein